MEKSNAKVEKILHEKLQFRIFGDLLFGWKSSRAGGGRITEEFKRYSRDQLSET